MTSEHLWHWYISYHLKNEVAIICFVSSCAQPIIYNHTNQQLIASKVVNQFYLNSAATF